MALEDNINALIEALRENTAALKATGHAKTADASDTAAVTDTPETPKTEAPKERKARAAKEAPAPEPAKPAEPEVTPEMVRDAVLKVKDVIGKEAASAIVKKHGKADKFALIDPSTFVAVHTAAITALETYDGTPAEDDEV